MATKYQQKRDELASVRKSIADLFAAGGEDRNLSEDQVSEIKQLNARANDLATECDSLREVDEIEAKNAESIRASRTPVRPSFYGGAADFREEPAEVKTLGDLFIESPAFTQYDSVVRRSPAAEVKGVEVKTLLAESAGFAPQAIRTGLVVDSAQQQPKIVDVIPTTTTDMVAVVYMRETTYTNAAAETAEGSLYPEAALQYTEVSSPVRKIAVFLPVTDEQLADVPGMKDRINNRLLLMLRQRLDQQLVSGNGTAPNLTGILNTSGILTQARGTDANQDAIYKAIVKEQTTDFSDPNAIVMNPLQWQTIRLMTSSTGQYIFGDPGTPGVQRLWGLPVVTSTYMTSGSAIVGDFATYSDIAYKAGIEFEISNSHSDFFQRGQLAIRAQFRCAFQLYRTTAFCSVTGLV